MKKLLLFILLFFFFHGSINAHTVSYDRVILHNWKNHNEQVIATGSFMLSKQGAVFIQDAKGRVVKIDQHQLCTEDIAYVEQKNAVIAAVNNQYSINNKSIQHKPSLYAILLLSGLFIFLVLLFFKANKQKRAYVLPILLAGIVFTILSFKKVGIKLFKTTTSTTFLDSTFSPFYSQIHTFYDGTYYYVESRGIPKTHEMMVGISNHGWQQQVPIPQCYIGANAWPIPLHPVVATTPIPVDAIHFTRGAIALAINGVPIFNVHTNTGVDSYVDGQLDAYGGHCGRADDYHYHIAPLHLYNYTTETMPIAFCLDGFAVYGSKEPDGTAMANLDVNHGHFGSNGVYHYHGTATAPYMVANMVGQVTEDTTHQLVPQSKAYAVRPALTPLSGALITNCNPNASNNGYKLIYTLSNVVDSVVYSWDLAGHYVFKFYTVSGLATNNYNGFTQCTVPYTTNVQTIKTTTNQFSIYPNPARSAIAISFVNPIDEHEFESLTIINNLGQEVYKTNNFTQNVSVAHFMQGTYIILVKLKNEQLVNRFVIQ